MLICIRCNQILNEGEKFCHLCAGLGVVPQNKRDAATQVQNEQSIITYWPWLAFYSLLFYLAILSINTSLTMSHSMGLIGHRSRFIRSHIRVEPFNQGDVILAVLLAVLGFIFFYAALRIMASRELKSASLDEFRVAAILTTSSITFFIWFFLEIDNQTINRSIIMTAVIAIFMAMFAMPKVKLPEDELNN